jgi:hypothetical protein
MDSKGKMLNTIMAANLLLISQLEDSVSAGAIILSMVAGLEEDQAAADMGIAVAGLIHSVVMD